MSTTVCNNDCICINCDCSYFHPITLQDRKICFKIYNKLSNPNKKEDDPDKRKANCSNGKLCIKNNCGYRHRLSFNDRLKLNESFQKTKIEVIKDIKVKPIKDIKNFTINTSNHFLLLPDDFEEEIKEEIKIPIEIKQGFKDALLSINKKEIKDEKKEIKIDLTRVIPENWADMCDSDDDDFFMKF